MAEKKTTANRQSGAAGRSASRTTAQKKTAKTSEAQRKREEAMRASRRKRRTAGIIMTAAGLLLLLLALIPGSMGWNALYNVTHGFFGAVAWAAGLLVIYAAITMLSNKTHGKIASTIIKTAVSMLILCAAAEIFGVGEEVLGTEEAKRSFGDVAAALWIDGKNFRGGGLFSMIFGVPLLFLGRTGASIVIIITSLACLVLMIDIPFAALFSKARGKVSESRERASEKREIRREAREITDEQYREMELRKQQERAQRRSERAERERGRRTKPYVSSEKKEKMREMREVVNSVNEPAVSEPQPAPEPPKEEGLPEPLPLKPSWYPKDSTPRGKKVQMPKMKDASPIMEQQQSDNRDYKEALKRYMEKKHPIMHEDGFGLTSEEERFEDADADIVPIIDALDKLNSERAPARVSKIVDAPAKDMTTSDKPFSRDGGEARGNDFDDDDDAEIPFDLEDIIAENAPKPRSDSTARTQKQAAPPSPAPRAEEKTQYTLADVYTLPPMNLLDEVKKPVKPSDIEEEIKQNADKLVKTLASFGVQMTYLGAARGPSVTRYELQPAPGVKLSKVANLADDVALNLAVSGVRIAPVPDKPAVGIEIPNKVKDTVFFRELVDTEAFKKTFDKKLVTVLGKDISGNSVTCNITKMPHLLIAGTTGSGKSVCVNSIIMSILMKSTPDDVRLIMVDPKQVEFMMYNGIPHLLIPVVTEPKKAAGALAWAVTEMENRYTLFSENNVRNIDGYNDLANGNDELPHMPHIVIFIDELADLMMASPKDVEDSIVRLAQKARAAGMYLVIATQKPTVQVVTGLIKGNIPSRIALLVSSNSDSRVILDGPGAEKLLGNGDMLYMPVGSQKPIRLQGCYVTDQEIERVVGFIKQTFTAEYDESIIAEIERQAEMVSSGGKEQSGDDFDDGEQDEKLEEAIEFVIEGGAASTSALQRAFKLGYGRAARLIDTMERMGVVGGYAGSKPRQVLMTKQEWYERKMRDN